MLTAERLKELLLYDPETRAWIWLIPTSNRVASGAMAGRKGGCGYWQIGIDGKRYPSARLAFLYMTGKWPSAYIDHVDRDSDNNRWANLREATNSQNMANRPKASSNTSGYKGVTWARRDKKWAAQIMVNGRWIGLGYFVDPKLASAAYVSAALKYFGAFSHA